MQISDEGQEHAQNVQMQISAQGTKWQLTAEDLSDEFWERADRLTRLRREEQRQMQESGDG